MSTDPKRNLSSTPELSKEAQQQLDHVLDYGLGDLSLRQILATAWKALNEAERRQFLNHVDDDKANGFYERSLRLGSIPLDVEVPRTRSGEFRPNLLPPPYQRSYPQETQSLLLGLLASSRSVNAAKTALRKLGLSVSEHELDSVANEFIQELELRNTRPLDTDLLALFIDAKYVELRDADRLRPATVYLACGLTTDGKKRVLACVSKLGRENLEDWKTILRGLIERGLRRVLIVVQDDFSGLLNLVKGLFPTADHQLCVVHMQRNAKSHLSKDDYAEFKLRLRTVKASWDEDKASAQFEELCERFDNDYPTFIAELRKKKTHYLCFLAYPQSIRRSLSTTNVVEAVNGQLERIRRNNGGYFQSEDALKLKLGMAISYLESGTWRRIAVNVSTALSQLNAMFQRRFENE
jgi:transposase-like protein